MKENNNETKEETKVEENIVKEEPKLSLWGCLYVILNDYGVDTSKISIRVGEHMVNDFIQLLFQQGYLG